MRPRSYVLIVITCILLALRSEAQTEPEVAKDHPATACRPCHTADRPTLADSTRAKCARVVPRGKHSAAEGPGIVTMNEKGEHYGRVVFSHRSHAEMSETGSGCSECHHEATEGRVMRKCSECHSPSRLRTDLEKPDLRGAIHRQCVACHRQWEPDIRCGACHAAEPGAATATDTPRESDGAFPRDILYRFHKSMACTDCHNAADAFMTLDFSCESCHPDWRQNFDHGKTGLALDDDHTDASCDDCHTDKTFEAPPSCAGCHDDKFYPGDKPGKPADMAATPAQRATP